MPEFTFSPEAFAVFIAIWQAPRIGDSNVRDCNGVRWPNPDETIITKALAELHACGYVLDWTIRNSQGKRVGAVWIDPTIAQALQLF